MRTRHRFVLIFFILSSALVAGSLYATANENYPPLQDGDLIFHTSRSSQSGAILIATADPFTHMGIIRNDGENDVVIEAAGKVKETPLRDWVNRGLLERVAIYRDPELTPAQAKQIIAAAKSYYGKSYDIFFSFNNDNIYCSELPYLAYKKAGISIGKVQKVSELNFDNALVRKLIKQRWQRHTECATRKYDFEQCYDFILNQDLVTPASIANDAKFEKIYSNYPL
ncbi:MAG: YiiX/YebB-like N1pC/P60 family cysteine hydrolase [Rickettsiales bacterium]